MWSYIIHFVCKCLWIYAIRPIISCRLFAYFALPCMSLWPSVGFFPICCIYVSVSPFMNLSFFCFWVFLTPGVPVYLYFVYFFFCASLIISPYQRLYSGCLCVSVLLARVLFLHVFLCIFPCLFLFVPLGMARVCVFLPCLLPFIWASLSECLSVSALLCLCWACLWGTRQMRSSQDIYPLSNPVCQWKDSRKLSSLLLPPDWATANIFHRDILILIFLTFRNIFCWHSSLTHRISILWPKCL